MPLCTALISLHCAQGVDIEPGFSGGAGHRVDPAGATAGGGGRSLGGIAGAGGNRPMSDAPGAAGAGGTFAAGGASPGSGTGGVGSAGGANAGAAGAGGSDPRQAADAATIGAAGGGGAGGAADVGPYGGAPTALPGIVQAENFDEGGQGVAYDDTNTQNYGSQYRETGVDIETCSDVGGGYDVGWNYPGEWRKYTVDVTATGTYSIAVRVASANQGGALHIEVDGTDRTGRLVAPSTGGWQIWASVSKSSVSLQAGRHVLKMDIDESTEFNINLIDVRRE